MDFEVNSINSFSSQILSNNSSKESKNVVEGFSEDSPEFQINNSIKNNTELNKQLLTKICQRDRIVTRAYADYYYKLSRNYTRSFWITNGSLSFLLMTSGILGLQTSNSTIQIIAKSIPIVMGALVPFLGKLDLGTRASNNERAGDDFSLLSIDLGREIEDGIDYETIETLRSKMDQYIKEYDEPPEDFIRNRKREIVENLKKESGENTLLTHDYFEMV